MTDEREPAWNEKLDIALDAMKERRVDISEPIFDELDDAHPGWQFEVPLRGKAFAQHYDGQRRPMPDTERCQVRMVRQLIATLIYATGTTTKSQLARDFDVNAQTMSNWLRRGDRILFGNCGALEEDFDPPEVRAKCRRNGCEHDSAHPTVDIGDGDGR